MQRFGETTAPSYIKEFKHGVYYGGSCALPGFAILHEDSDSEVITEVSPAVVAFLGEIGMVVALFLGMNKHESTVVVATYYITMTLFASNSVPCPNTHLTGFGAHVIVTGSGGVARVASTLPRAICDRRRSSSRSQTKACSGR